MNKIFTNIKFSVIIPVYNTEKYIKETLDSLISQSYDNWEAVCIDDASIDASLNIRAKYSTMDERIKVFSLSQNSGAIIAREKGINIADGDFLVFLDSDDTLSRTALYEIVNCITNYQEVNCVCLDHKYENEYSTWRGKCLYSGYKAFLEIAHFKLPRPVAFDRKLCQSIKLDDVSLDRGKGNFYDEYLWMKYILACKNVAIAKGCYYYYRKREGQATDPNNIIFYDKLERSYLVHCLMESVCDKDDLLKHRRFMVFELAWHYGIYKKNKYSKECDFYIRQILYLSYSKLKKKDTFYLLFSSSSVKDKLLAILFMSNWRLFQLCSLVKMRI